MSTFIDNEAVESEDELISGEAGGQGSSSLNNRTHELSEDDHLISEADEDGTDATDNKSIQKRRRKSGKHSSDEDDRLMEDDYELLEENLGIKFKRKFKRVKVINDDDSDEDQAESDARNKIAEELFDLDEEFDDGDQQKRALSPSKSYSSEESSEDEIDDFIVDDSGAAIRRARPGEVRVTDERLQAAQDIFGVDFDINEFNEGRGYDEDDNSDEEDQPRRKSDLRKSRKWRDIYEPSDLERLHFTKLDSEICQSDIPERIQRINVPRFPITEFPIIEEATWIFYELQKIKKRLGKAYENEDLEDISTKFDQSGQECAFGPNNMEDVLDVQRMTNDIANTKLGGLEDNDWGEETPAAQKSLAVPIDEDWDKETTVSENHNPTGILSEKISTPGDTDDWERSSIIISQTAVVPPSNQIKSQVADADDNDWEEGSVLQAVLRNREDDGSSSVRTDLDLGNSEGIKENEAVINKIETVLKFIKVDGLEVPYISTYRKDVYMPELTVKDLWSIYRQDINYCVLHKSKKKMMALISNTKDFLEDEVNKDNIEALLGKSYRKITLDDFDVISDLQSIEEINDFRSYYSLYYEAIATAVKAYVKETGKLIDYEQRNSTMGVAIVKIEQDDVKSKDSKMNTIIHKRRPCASRYEISRKSLNDFLPNFGMSAADFAVNVRYAYEKISPEPSMEDHIDIAGSFTSQKFPSRQLVIESASFVMATQISREIEIRKVLRDHLWEKGGLSVTPTQTGFKLIDETHPLYKMKYLRNKPAQKFVRDEFLKLISAEQDRLVEIRISQEFVDSLKESLVEDWIGYFSEDGYSSIIEGWNLVKRRCIEKAVFEIILPSLVKELKLRLEKDSKTFVIRACRRKIRNYINVAKFHFSLDPETPSDYVSEEWSTEKSGRVLAITYDSNPSIVPFACVLNPDGSVLDHIPLKNVVIFGKPSPYDLELQATAIASLRDFILSTKPHIIIVGGESFEAYDLEHVLKEMLLSIKLEEEGFPLLSVEIFDNDASKVYSNCNRAVSEFPDNPALLRQAISLGRRLIDPLVEIGQLFNPDDDILCLKLHPLQSRVLKEDLLDAVQEEFVLCVNKVGLDFNRCLTNFRVAQLLQFVSGLGPSKASLLIQLFRRKPSNLKNRNQLCDIGRMGPCIFRNCAGFIKVIWREFELSEQEDNFIEYLDCTRVHPENYDLARQIAGDAYAEEDEDGNVIETNLTEDEYVKMALDDPITSYEKISNLSMEEFANSLVKESGLPYIKKILDDIVTEFYGSYKDPRHPYVTPSLEETFSLLTKETAETLFVGKLLIATVTGFCTGCKLPNEEPEKLDDGNWQCPVCKKQGFEDHDKVYDHYDTPRGVFLRLDNGLKGYIPADKLSDKKIVDVSQRVRPGQPVHCRVVDFNVGARKVTLTSTSADLRDDLLKPQKDFYYDRELEAQENVKLQKNQSGQTQYRRRAIVHPSFHNITYAECVPRMSSMDVGDAIFRPSSKGTNHMTLSWKMTDSVLHHVDILELNKTGDEISIGRILVVDGEEYEDLDEILTRYVYRISLNIREILHHKNYFDFGDSGKQKAEELLKNKQKENMHQLHYVLSHLTKCPGRFLISYLLSASRLRFAHEIVTVVPDGFRYRGDMFESLLDLLKYFKTHYKDPPPNATPSLSTPSYNG